MTDTLINRKLEEVAPVRSRPRRTRLWVLLGVTGLSALLIAAYAHLLIVAFQSQPDCVPHSKAGEVSPQQNTAAKSSC